MGTTAKTNEPSTPSDLKERLARAQRELEALRHKTSRATNITILVSAIALVGICTYFYYGYTQISQLTEPDKLVSYAQQIIDDQLPTVHDSLKEQIIKSAPTWAEGLSKQALESLPAARGKLESYALEQYDSSAHETITLTDKEFRSFLQKNRPLLEQKFKELGSNPRLADQSLAELQERLEETLQGDMQAQAGQMLATLQSLNAKLKKLRAGENLSPEESTERRLLMLVRRMRMEEKDPTLAGKNLPETPRDDIRAVALKTPRPGTARGRAATPRPGLAAKPPGKGEKADAKVPAVTARPNPSATGAKPPADQPAKPSANGNDKKGKPVDAEKTSSKQ